MRRIEMTCIAMLVASIRTRRRSSSSKSLPEATPRRSERSTCSRLPTPSSFQRRLSVSRMPGLFRLVLLSRICPRASVRTTTTVRRQSPRLC
jgi:hypothetical protein